MKKLIILEECGMLLLAIAGLWHIDPRGDDWESRVTRLLDFVMDGLRAGAAGR